MDDATSLRRAMVDQQIIARGVSDPRVIHAMLTVPREAFVPEGWQAHAYNDGPLPIGADQTISQPYIVGLMIEAAAMQPGDRVLEIGAGSGYAAAVMSRIAGEVWAIERIPKLADRARRVLADLGCDNVMILDADGTAGLPERAPFQAIIVSAAAPTLPPALLEQLAPGGRLVAPLGGRFQQQLTVYSRTEDGSISAEDLGGVAFVPLISGQV
ncbi:hypothetical protein ACFB49_47580 [Sphingomonas sp. DBB INV C78]|uniref:protein-L-isoaspartate(D-aspartate) O-methyltransferase n=1 Tax=Sphingomonas sp. DBB INV C78 TaxID=3349434 RepID=UPI0036D34325